MKPATTLAITILLAALAVCSAPAQVPSILNYQGRVTVGGTNLTTNAALFKFALVNGDGSTVYWRNDGSAAAGEPSGAVSVAVAQGLYSALLGDTSLSNMAPIPAAVFSNANVNLRVWFSDGGTNPFVQLVPDQRIGAAGYALRAASAESAAIGNVTGDLSVGGTLYVGKLIGGTNNTSDAIDSTGAVIAGGEYNIANFPYATVGGGRFISATAAFSTVAGGLANNATAEVSTVGGGSENTASGLFATVGGGNLNSAAGSYTVVSGGYASVATNEYATVGGGAINYALGYGATVGGGYGNAARNYYATVSGGIDNTATGSGSFVAGGQQNTASGSNAIVPGGQLNAATNFAFASGRRAKATNDGAFVWADSTDADFGSTTNNQFLVRAAGGVGINTNNPGTNALTVAGSANIAGNLNVGSINGQKVLSSYTTTFSFVQDNGSVGQSLPFGNSVIATFVQRPGVAVTSCSIAYSLNGLVQGTVNFYDATGLSIATIGSNSLVQGSAPTFTDSANPNTYKLYDLGGLNIAPPAATPRIVQIVMNSNGGGSSQIKIYSITVGFTPN